MDHPAPHWPHNGEHDHIIRDPGLYGHLWREAALGDVDACRMLEHHVIALDAMTELYAISFRYWEERRGT